MLLTESDRTGYEMFHGLRTHFVCAESEERMGLNSNLLMLVAFFFISAQESTCTANIIKQNSNPEQRQAAQLTGELVARH